MVFLGVDTSNYATSLAVVNAAGEVVCAEKQFLPVREGQLGLRQSDALFHHTVALPAMAETLQQAGALRGLAGVGVSARPRPVDGSYMPCFLAGVSFAAAVSAALDVPLVRTSHQQGHIAAARLGTGVPALQNGQALVFHVSGGTTELLLADGCDVLATLGTSLDLYAGQAVDRLGVKLGFGFPAGAEVSALAAGCPDNIRPKTSLKGADCHFSGLENQCAKLLEDGKPPAYVAKFCLVSVAATLEGMIRAARALHPGLPVVCAGGVTASGIVRSHLACRLQHVHFAPPELSADSAVGPALIAAKEASHG